MLEYPGCYTQRVAITNSRMIAIDNGSVRFSYRDRSDDNKEKELTISAHVSIKKRDE